MEVPWERLTGGTLKYVGPSDWVVPAGDWAEAERRLGSELPGDYKELVGDQGALVFAGELVIGSPFDGREHLNLLCVAARGSWALACLREQFAELARVPVHPEQDGLLCWGTDGGGATYYWDRNTSDPNSWGLLVAGRPIPELAGRRVNQSLRSYLDALANGSLVSESLDGWPADDVSIRPL